MYISWCRNEVWPEVRFKSFPCLTFGRTAIIFGVLNKSGMCRRPTVECLVSVGAGEGWTERQVLKKADDCTISFPDYGRRLRFYPARCEVRSRRDRRRG